jgi:hypothetical protein
MRTYLVYELTDGTWVRKEPPEGVLAPGYAVDLAEKNESRTLSVLVQHAKKGLTPEALAELNKTLNMDIERFSRGCRVGKLIAVITNNIDWFATAKHC